MKNIRKIQLKILNVVIIIKEKGKKKREKLQ